MPVRCVGCPARYIVDGFRPRWPAEIPIACKLEARSLPQSTIPPLPLPARMDPKSETPIGRQPAKRFALGQERSAWLAGKLRNYGQPYKMLLSVFTLLT